MRYLFVHQNFPGQYLHIIRHVAADPANEVVFIGEPNSNVIPGVRRLLYTPPKPSQDGVHPVARDFDLGVRRAEIVAGMAGNLKRLGFSPDIIVGHHGWGELLNLPDVWPEAPILGYLEFYYHPDGQDVNFDPEFPIGRDRFARIRAMNVINHQALTLGHHGQTPTRWQLTRYPAWAQGSIHLVREGARLELCKPDPAKRKLPFSIGDFTVAPNEKLVTYVARNLEPYRGFHVMMRALEPLLAARPDVKVVMVGGDDVSYGARLSSGTWREHFLREMAGRYDASRVCLPGQIPYERYLHMMQRSDAHVYLTYPFVASWSLREAMAMGCALVVADVESVTEFVTHDRTGLVVPCLDHKRVAEAVLQLLEDDKLAKRLRGAARRYAEKHLDMNDYVADMQATIGKITGNG